MGVLDWTWASRRGRDEVKSAWEGIAGRGVRRSEEMVMGSAKRAWFEVKSAKAVWRSSEAEAKVVRSVLGLRGAWVGGIVTVPVMPDCMVRDFEATVYCRRRPEA